MAKFNYKTIRTAIANSEQGKKRVNTVMQTRFEIEKKALIEEFNNHPVTKEIEQGGDNISGTLEGKGNLRAFIGFVAGDDPIQPVRQILEEKLVFTSKQNEVTSDRIKYKFSLRIPKEELRTATPMPWESGISWLGGIETGRISGLANFLAGRFNSPDPSRSGEGIQVNHIVRSSSFRKTEYLNAMFAKLVAKFQ